MQRENKKKKMGKAMMSSSCHVAIQGQLLEGIQPVIATSGNNGGYKLGGCLYLLITPYGIVEEI